jgi:hypothetical protein
MDRPNRPPLDAGQQIRKHRDSAAKRTPNNDYAFSALCEIVVRAEGFEPPRLAPLEPKSSASTSSATPASSLPIAFQRGRFLPCARRRRSHTPLAHRKARVILKSTAENNA